MCVDSVVAPLMANDFASHVLFTTNPHKEFKIFMEEFGLKFANFQGQSIQ